MKKLLLLSFISTAFALHAAEQFPTETSFKWSGTSRFPAPNLEIRNKDNYMLEVTVVNGEKEQKFTIPANKSKFFEKDIPVVRLRGLNLSKQTKIYIKFNPGQKSWEHIYFIEPGYHIFVSWEKGNLRPQTGKSGKTQSGINLKTTENVTEKVLNAEKGTREL